MHDIEVQYVADCPNLPVLLARLEAAVSYTHLTLPTNREV